MSYLKHKLNSYFEGDFKNYKLASLRKGSYYSQRIEASTMSTNNTEGSDLVCIASYRIPNIYNNIVENFNYYFYHVGFYEDVKTFLNLKFQNYDDNWFIFVPVSSTNGLPKEIIEDIKNTYHESIFIDLESNI